MGEKPGNTFMVHAFRAAFTVMAVAAIGTVAAYAGNPIWTQNTASIGTDGYKQTGIWTDEGGLTHSWDDKSAIDYHVPFGLSCKTPFDNNVNGKSNVFSQNDGTSLTLEAGRGADDADCARMTSKTKTLTIPQIIAKDWSMIAFGNYRSDNEANQELKGSVTVATDAEAPARIRSHAKNTAQTVSASISGSGALWILPENRNAKYSGTIILSGDNGGWLGMTKVHSDNLSTITLSVSSSENLGGNPAAIAQKGLELGTRASLNVNGDAALGANRGFYVSDDSTVSVASDKTFTVPGMLGFESGKTLTKSGAGTLALSGDVSGWVERGTVALNSGTLAIESATIANGIVTPVSIGALATVGGASVAIRVIGDGSTLAYDTSYVILVSSSTLPEGFADMVSIRPDDGAFILPTGAAVTYSVVDGTKLSITVGAYKGDPVWIGGGKDGNFSTSANWLGGIGPTANSAVPLSFAAGNDATIVNDIEGLTPVSITFRAGCAAVAMCGNALDIPRGGSIINNSAAIPVFSNAVAFAGAIDVAGSVNFAGGVTGTEPVNHMTYMGRYTITANEWTPPAGAVVPSGSVVNVLHTLLNGQELAVKAGGTVRANSLTRRYYGESGVRTHQLYENFGTLSVGEIRWTGSISSTSGDSAFFPVVVGGGKIVFRAERLVNNVLAGNGAKSSVVYLSNGGWENVFVIGAGGLAFEKPDGAGSWNAQYQVQNNETVTLAPVADWSLHANPADRRRGLYMGNNATLNILTSDYDDPAVPRTVTIESSILDGGTGNTKINVTGSGTLLYRYANHDTSWGALYKRAFNVSGSATFSLASGCSLGAATFSMSDTSTLEVAQSGAVALGGNLTLGEKASLAFRFTERTVAPKLAIPSDSTIPATVNVKISAADGAIPSSVRTYALTSGYDFTGKTVKPVDFPKWVQSVAVIKGDLVLTVKPKGLRIVVR